MTLLHATCSGYMPPRFTVILILCNTVVVPHLLWQIHGSIAAVLKLAIAAARFLLKPRRSLLDPLCHPYPTLSKGTVLHVFSVEPKKFLHDVTYCHRSFWLSPLTHETLGYIHLVCTSPQISSCCTRWISRWDITSKKEGGKAFSNMHMVKAVFSYNSDI
jgi:hypothetical protein